MAFPRSTGVCLAWHHLLLLQLNVCLVDSSCREAGAQLVKESGVFVVLQRLSWLKMLLQKANESRETDKTGIGAIATTRFGLQLSWRRHITSSCNLMIDSNI